MNPKEKLPLESNNMNSITFRPQTTNPVTENEIQSDITSKQAGNEVKKAVEAFERSLMD
ncbi:hypothetical protein NBE98_07855 [Clostridium swellfunianum]|uniref:hypothetical protein n=1 Tax=Clostridium swellfunianum TaxID=1367462 RepID=UPI00202F6FA4|nr:hypothetical protein [Clostridium swellfunianum]MCM0648286.1 hypothetical protein [Clostridium swellfunianum]